jgi:hypothetical protein
LPLSKPLATLLSRIFVPGSSNWSGFEFVFQGARVIDRSPRGPTLDAQAGFHGLGGMSAKAGVQKATYPSPPVGLAVDKYVEMIFNTYRNYLNRIVTISHAANFCLTAVELAGSVASASPRGGKRDLAAKHFNIQKKVLDTIGDLCANKGGREARKAIGAKVEFSTGERTWLEEAMKKLLQRTAEAASDPTKSYPKITLADLPSLP